MTITGMGLAHAIWFCGVAGLATVAMFTDMSARKIPNWLTVPGFLLGLCFQIVANGGPGVVDGMMGSGIGAFLLLLMWLCGGGGGGDVKLIGSLGIWLGAWQTICVLTCSTFFIAISTLVFLIYKQFTVRRTASLNGLPVTNRRGIPRVRLVIPYAVPVGFATWILLLGNGRFQLPL